MRALNFITGHVIYNLNYTYKFQLKTTLVLLAQWVICALLLLSGKAKNYENNLQQNS
mgnify:CR=1 FL=1